MAFNYDANRPLRDTNNTIRNLDTRNYPGTGSTEIAKIIVTGKKSSDAGNVEIYSDFIVNRIQARIQEKVQVFTTFSKDVALFFGTHPQNLVISGFLVNYVSSEKWLGKELDKDIKKMPWSSRFIGDYLGKLKGTESIKRDSIVFFDFYDWVYTGRFIDLSYVFDATSQEMVPFTMTMYVTNVVRAATVAFGGQGGFEEQAVLRTADEVKASIAANNAAPVSSEISFIASTPSIGTGICPKLVETFRRGEITREAAIRQCGRAAVPGANPRITMRASEIVGAQIRDYGGQKTDLEIVTEAIRQTSASGNCTSRFTCEGLLRAKLIDSGYTPTQADEIIRSVPVQEFLRTKQ